jgi:hypothetical protein
MLHLLLARQLSWMVASIESAKQTRRRLSEFGLYSK